jgi:hypothetical protein
MMINIRFDFHCPHQAPAARWFFFLALTAGAFALAGCFPNSTEGGSTIPHVDTTPAMPGLAWTWRNPMPLGNALLSIAKSPTCWIMTGENGSLVRSTDGEHWTTVNSWQTFSDVIWAQGRFTAVGGAEV